MSDYYGRDGSPISAEAWTLKDNAVAKTTVGGVEVSTIYLGLDHGCGVGRPLIFETMVFGGINDGWQWRYSTEERAVAAHALIVQALENGWSLGDLVVDDG